MFIIIKICLHRLLRLYRTVNSSNRREESLLNQSPQNLKQKNQDLQNLNQNLILKNKFLLRIEVKLNQQMDKMALLMKVERHIESNNLPTLRKMINNR